MQSRNKNSRKGFNRQDRRQGQQTRRLFNGDQCEAERKKDVWIIIKTTVQHSRQHGLGIRIEI